MSFLGNNDFRNAPGLFVVYLLMYVFLYSAGSTNLIYLVEAGALLDVVMCLIMLSLLRLINTHFISRHLIMLCQKFHIEICFSSLSKERRHSMNVYIGSTEEN